MPQGLPRKIRVAFIVQVVLASLAIVIVTAVVVGFVVLTIVGIVLAFGVAFLGMSWIMHAVGADSLLSI